MPALPFLSSPLRAFLRRAALPAVLAAAALGAAAAPVEVGGTRFDERVELRGAPLQLNGAGVRYKAVFKVYAAGLYLAAKAGTPEEVLAAPGPKRMSITMLRSIDANELGKLFTRGVEDNSPKGEMSQLIPGLLRMSQIFSDQKQLQPGETFTIDWLPGTGTVISVKGVAQGEPIKEAAFFNALMRIWLGPVPADGRLKDALLGRPG